MKSLSSREGGAGIGRGTAPLYTPLDPAEIAKERRKFDGYPPAMHSMSQEKRHKIIIGNELNKL